MKPALCLILSVGLHAGLFAVYRDRPVRERTLPPMVSMTDQMVVSIVLNEVVPLPDPPPEPVEEVEIEEPETILVVEDAPTPEVPAVVEEPEEEKVETEDVPDAVAATTEATEEVADAYWSEVCRCIVHCMRYPQQARAKRWSGLVVVQLEIDKSGRMSGTIKEGQNLRPYIASAIRKAIDRASPVTPPPPELATPLRADLPIRFVL